MTLLPPTAALRAALVTATLALAAFATPGRAATLPLPARLDLKPAGAAIEPGWTAVTPADLFTAAAAFGFTAAPVDAPLGATPGHDVIDRDDDERMLLRGCIRVAAGTELRLRIAPDQSVRVRCVLALTPPISGLADTTGAGFEVRASKGAALATVSSGVDLRTPYKRVDLATTSGSYRKLWFTAKSAADGLLRLRFEGGGGTPIPVAAVEVHAFEPSPLTYRRAGATFLQPAPGVTVPGLAAFHAHDCAAAEAGFLSIADPLTRATALAWLGAWLCGCEDGHGEVLEVARAILDLPSLAASARARELRDQLDDLRLADLHESLRLYSIGSAPPPLGYGYFDLSLPGVVLANPPFAVSDLERHDYLAETLYAQAAGLSLDPILAFDAGSHPDPDFEVSPLAFRSLDRIARIHYGHNPNHVVGPNAAAQLAIWEGIWQGFDAGGFLSLEFAGDAELGAIAYMARADVHQHAKAGGLQKFYDGAPFPASYLDPADAWWTPLVTPPSPPPAGAPGWAIVERDALHAVRAAARWWLEHREQGGEFGGGPGDDPELVGLLMVPWVALRAAADEPERAALLRAGDAVLDGGSVADGYYAGGLTDVEHTAEPTTYPLYTALSLLPGEPHYLQRCLDVAKHLRYPSAPAKAWCGLDPAQNLRFHSYWFNADGPSNPLLPEFQDKDRDVPLCGKALVPPQLFLARAPHPLVGPDLAAWAAGWRDLALNPTGGRPLGLVPAAVRLADLSEGFGGAWWLSGAPAYDFPANVLALDHLYGAAFEQAYRQGGPNAHSFLLPLLRLAQGMIELKAQLDQGTPPADLNVVGSASWARNVLLSAPSFLDTLAIGRASLLSDPVLTTQDDPDTPGPAPYVTPAFAAALDALLLSQNGGYLTYLTNPQPFDASTGWDNKDKGVLNVWLQRTEAWLQNAFPLATTTVRATDRSNLFIQGSQKILHGMMTGGQFGSPLPLHLVTWESLPQDPAPLDVAVLVNDLATTASGAARLRVLAYGFDAAPRELGFRLWHRLPLGRYHLRHGPASAGTDHFTGTPTQVDVDFARRGERFSVPLPPATLTLLELEWFQPLSTPPAFDVAVSAIDATLAFAPGGPLGVILQVTQPVVNTGAGPAPAAAVKVRAGVRDPSGALLPLGPSGEPWIDVPLATAPAGIPAVTGFTLPSSDARFDLPLFGPLIELWLLGYAIDVRFEATVADFDPGNDVATLRIDLQTLLEL